MDNKFDDSKSLLFSDDKSFQDFEFDSYSRDFNDIGITMSNNGVSSINVEEYAFQELDLDAKYRSIQVVNPNSFSAYSSPALNVYAPPLLSKSSVTTPNANGNHLLKKAPPAIVVKSTFDHVIVPEIPFYVAATQFTTSNHIDAVISTIESELLSVSEVACDFYHDKCRWDCVYLCGPTRCKFEFNVFKSGDGTYVIEGNRLSGEGFPFSTIFRNLRAKFSEGPSCSSPNSVVNFQFIPMPDTMMELSSHEITEAVVPILAMAASGKCESQVNAAQIFCDLSLQQNMGEVLCQADCINALVSLCRMEFDCCNQHAVCALANLSSLRSCQDVLLRDASFLQHLLLLCRDGNYNTAEMRRECARLLANLCSAKANASAFLEAVGVDELAAWLDSVDNIKDDRLRLHASRAKYSIHSAAE